MSAMTILMWVAITYFSVAIVAFIGALAMGETVREAFLIGFFWLPLVVAHIVADGLG